MQLNPKQYAASLLELARGATKKEVPAIVDQFIQYLVRQRQFSFVNKILEQLENLARTEEGKVKVVIQSANRIDKFTRAHILDFLRKKESEVEFEETIDPNILGGVRLRLNDLLIDATITGQLERLKQSLQ